ncbi:MAG: dihydrofolate reductase, partial [Burkholderiaceae bacterium]
MTVPVTIIVARARNGVIGAGSTLPWHLPEELQHFKAATLGHAVIMGRKTFDSIGKPLPGRRNIVVSRNPHWQHPGCETAGDLQQALQLC